MVSSVRRHIPLTGRLFSLACVLSACAVLPSPTPSQPPGDELSADLAEWASEVRDIVWRDARPGDPPALPAVRFETCSDLALVFFLDPDAEGVLWAAGSPTEPPAAADGGFSPALDTPEIQAYRDEHGPCELLYETHFFR